MKRRALYHRPVDEDHSVYVSPAVVPHPSGGGRDVFLVTLYVRSGSIWPATRILGVFDSSDRAIEWAVGTDSADLLDSGVAIAGGRGV